MEWTGEGLQSHGSPPPQSCRQKKKDFFFLEPPLNAQGSRDCGPKKRIIWCNLLVHQTHGGISGEFGVESKSRANRISREIPEQMEFLGNLVWRTFSKNC
jgi:hypothetical protein